jgi:hypothetical protein
MTWRRRSPSYNLLLGIIGTIAFGYWTSTNFGRGGIVAMVPAIFLAGSILLLIVGVAGLFQAPKESKPIGIGGSSPGGYKAEDGWKNGKLHLTMKSFKFVGRKKSMEFSWKNIQKAETRKANIFTIALKDGTEHKFKVYKAEAWTSGINSSRYSHPSY